MFKKEQPLIKFLIVNGYTGGEDEYTQKVELLSTDKKTVIGQFEQKFRLEDELEVHYLVAKMELGIVNPGIYWIRILLDREERMLYPLRIITTTTN